MLPIPSLTAHEDIYTIPNLLTASRLVAAPFIGYAILHDAHAWALGLFVYAGVSDLLDGWIARRWKLQSVVGSVIDPMADKILMTILTICLATKGALPGELTTPSSKLSYCRFMLLSTHLVFLCLASSWISFHPMCCHPNAGLRSPAMLCFQLGVTFCLCTFASSCTYTFAGSVPVTG